MKKLLVMMFVALGVSLAAPHFASASDPVACGQPAGYWMDPKHPLDAKGNVLTVPPGQYPQQTTTCTACSWHSIGIGFSTCVMSYASVCDSINPYSGQEIEFWVQCPDRDHNYGAGPANNVYVAPCGWNPY